MKISRLNAPQYRQETAQTEWEQRTSSFLTCISSLCLSLCVHCETAAHFVAVRYGCMSLPYRDLTLDKTQLIFLLSSPHPTWFPQERDEGW